MIIKEIMGTYKITAMLGKGSGGIVYRAYHKRLHKDVVLKKLHSNNRTESCQRREVDILKRLNHSYLPQVLDFLELDQEVYTVMSYVPGKSFQQLLEEGRRFTEKEIIHWAIQLCQALEYLHSQNPPVIHGDIKPSNIMLTPEGDICLIDFNVSFLIDDKMILGYTSGYASPEQYVMAMGQKMSEVGPAKARIGEKSDIYSLGAALYRLATGKKIENYQQGIDYEYLLQKTSESFARIIQIATVVQPEGRFVNVKKMEHALKDIPKKNKRYRKLLLRQKIEMIMLAVLLVVSCVALVFGIKSVGTEKDNRYRELVQKQKMYTKSEEYDQQNDAYEEAKEINEKELEAHYQNAASLYARKKYEDCVTFIDQAILEDRSVKKPEAHMDEVYYLKADSLFRLKDYEGAVEAYEMVTAFSCGNSMYYRDYAIALVYKGQEQKAREVLGKAIEYGLQDDSAYYVKGEIDYAVADLTNAIQNFDKCIEVSEDDYMKMRAYVMKSKVLEEKDSLNEAREVLLTARQELPVKQQLNVLECLVSIDLELMNTGDSRYLAEAITISEEIIEQNWGTYTTYDNLVVLYQQQQDLSKAIQTLEKMETDFGADYNIYKRYAFLELEEQERKANHARDYCQFQIYYKKASELYLDQLQNKQTDTEMQLLDQLYMQAEKGGWFS